MEENGYVKIFRKFKRWGWYQDMPVKSVFLHCLLSASYCDFEWLGKKYKSGQFITGRKRMAEETGLSEWQVLRALKKLKSTGEITTFSTNKHTVITVNKWLDYQLYEKSYEETRNESSTTTTQQTANPTAQHSHNESTLYKNNKNIKNKKKEKEKFVSAYPNVLNLADLYGHCLKKD